MTKSRTALATLVPLVAAWPGAALAQIELPPQRAAWDRPPPATAEAVLAAYQAQLDVVIRTRCHGGADGEVVVCGPAGGGEGMRIPYVPEPGSIHRVAGEAPTGGDALSADRCLRLCQQPLTVDVIGAARAINRGLGRLFHPD